MNGRYRRASLALAIAAGVACARAALAIPAFPGAEGYGANALGGRGGEVFHVTSLADTNSGTYSSVGFKGGTLRYCLTQSSAQPRTIVFDISGTIALTSSLTVAKSKITIAGQTAPGQGITLRDNTFQIAGGSSNPISDIIVRHIRSRKGDLNTSEDAFGVLGGSGTANTAITQNVVVDHVSASWGEDEVLSLTNHSTNVTVQNSNISEGLDAAGHGYGSLLRPEIPAHYTLHHNLWADNRSRNPRPGSYNAATEGFAAAPQFEIKNNVIYNWMDRATYTGGSAITDGREYIKVDYAGNYGIDGPSLNGAANSTAARTLFTVTSNATAQIFQSGNLVDADKDALRNGANLGTTMFVQQGDGIMTLTGASVIDPAAIPVTLESATAAYNRILARGGALPWARDPVDDRIINQVKTATGSVILSQNDVGGWPAIPTITRAANWDTDFDGMPDWWELDRSTNRLVADQNVVTASGYTQLENYLNAIVNTSNWGVDADGNWSNDANWLGGAPNGVDALAGFASGITAPHTITVNAPQTVGILQFDSAVPYTLQGGGANQITLDDSAGRAAINVLNGSHTIAAPLNLVDDTAIVVLSANSTLTITGQISAGANRIIKDGAGAVQVPNVRAGVLDVNAGTVVVAANGTSAGASRIASLNLAGGPVPGATLDLNDNSIVVGSSTPAATLQAQLANARHGGAWDQPGITSSAARSQPDHATTLGLLTGAEYSNVGGNGTFEEQGYAPADSLIKYTWYGDTDFNGVVNFDDYVRTDNGFNNQLTGWLNGDFDLNGAVNFDDYVLIDLAFNTQTGTLARALAFLDGSDRSNDGMHAAGLRKVEQHLQRFGEAYARGFVAAVPEPASLASLALAASAVRMLRRRRDGLG